MDSPASLPADRAAFQLLPVLPATKRSRRAIVGSLEASRGFVSPVSPSTVRRIASDVDRPVTVGRVCVPRPSTPALQTPRRVAAANGLLPEEAGPTVLTAATWTSIFPYKRDSPVRFTTIRSNLRVGREVGAVRTGGKPNGLVRRRVSVPESGTTPPVPS